jgi:hypothetical protein
VLFVDQYVDAFRLELLLPPPVHPDQRDGFRPSALTCLWITRSALDGLADEVEEVIGDPR